MEKTQSSSSQPPLISARCVRCDQCRQRRVRCDGAMPCAHCQRAKLTCKRDYIPKRQGRKVGSGQVIAALRAAQLSDEAHCGTKATDQIQPTASSTTTDLIHSAQEEISSATAQLSRHRITFSDVSSDDIGLSDTVLLPLIKQCVHIYLQNMYPIMPILEPSELRQMLDRPWKANESSMLLALCALVTTFMCGRSASIFGSFAWEPIAQYFLRESLAARMQYDYIHDCSLFTLLTSFFISTTHFELHNIKPSWFYLREAITLAQALGLHTEAFYRGLDCLEALYCRRIYCILFVTERCDPEPPCFLLHPSTHSHTICLIDLLQYHDTSQLSCLTPCLFPPTYRKMSNPRLMLASDSSSRFMPN